MKGIAIFLSLSAMMLSSVAPAGARGIAQYVRPQPDAPVQISSCSEGIQFNSNQWGTTNSTLNTGVNFRNTSTKTAIEVLFRMQLSNGFGIFMDNIFGQATGQFAANADIKGNHWAQTDAWPGLGEIQCSVARVLFSDGSVWTEPKIEAAPNPSPIP